MSFDLYEWLNGSRAPGSVMYLKKGRWEYFFSNLIVFFFEWLFQLNAHDLSGEDVACKELDS